MTGLFLGYCMLSRRPGAVLLAVFAISACILPTLIVWGIKTGYIEALVDQLRLDPANVEIRLRGDRALTADDFDAIRSLAGIGYVEPTTRGLSLRVFVSRADGSRRTEGSLLPSTPGDPLLERFAPPAEGEVLISADLATQLGVAPGDRIEIATRRDGVDPLMRIPLVVGPVVPRARLAGQRLLVAPDLIVAVENFVEGYGVPRFRIAGRDPSEQERAFASARIYARDLESVEAVTEQLNALGHRAEANVAMVSFALRLNRAADLLTLLLGTVLTVGSCISLWGALSLGFLPLQRHIALLRLMGGTKGDVASMVFGQAVGIGCAAIVFSGAGFIAVAALINPLLGHVAIGSSVVFLSERQLAAAAAATAGAVLLVAGVFTIRYWTLAPTGALRDAL
ncbi:hypothetical protein [Ancylobacter amanitiformis]|uniref:ABC transport system permease protein n=1 Tax=Ancylobacter amanitiformis TaxID=217069 RepID=A0ABU0LPV9_9HYPH|nr:hypothetical protein [Ancylobacter amanitiformis]MDQ0510743.1 putative ABC transport system permease protein [Ancylobacter amanitiformis]